METIDKTLQELAKEAIAVQNACNLSGVAQSFARAMIQLGKHTNGTQERNSHPVAQVYISKLADLSGIDHALDANTWTKVYDLAEGK